MNRGMATMSNSMPLYEETMRKLNSLTSPDFSDSEYTNTFDITESVFPNPSGFCDNSRLNSEGNSPASSVDESEKQKQDKVCLNDLFITSQNGSDFPKKKSAPELLNSNYSVKTVTDTPFAYYQCSVLSNLTSEDIIKSSAVDTKFLTISKETNDSRKLKETSTDLLSSSSYGCEEIKDNQSSKTSTPNEQGSNLNTPVSYHTSLLHDNINDKSGDVSDNKQCSVNNCFVDLGERIQSEYNNVCSLNSSHHLTKSCSVALIDLIHSKDEEIQAKLKNYQSKKAKLVLKNKKRRIRRKKLREINSKATSTCPVKHNRPNISTSRWLHLWREGDSQLHPVLNEIHVTRNSVRFIQDMVHYDQ